jgi:hypothetical protein
MAINLNLVGKSFAPVEFTYRTRDVILYALGVGAGPDELGFVYENGLQVLPTFAVIPAFPAAATSMPDLNVNPMMVVHGEQADPAAPGNPRRGTIRTSATVRITTRDRAR